jgi:hypothetical protein
MKTERVRQSTKHTGANRVSEHTHQVMTQGTCACRHNLQYVKGGLTLIIFITPFWVKGTAGELVLRSQGCAARCFSGDEGTGGAIMKTHPHLRSMCFQGYPEIRNPASEPSSAERGLVAAARAGEATAMSAQAHGADGLSDWLLQRPRQGQVGWGGLAPGGRSGRCIGAFGRPRRTGPGPAPAMGDFGFKVLVGAGVDLGQECTEVVGREMLMDQFGDDAGIERIEKVDELNVQIYSCLAALTQVRALTSSARFSVATVWRPGGLCIVGGIRVSQGAAVPSCEKSPCRRRASLRTSWPT